MAIKIQIINKRLLFGLISFILIIGFITISHAATVTWTGNGSDSLASTSANWNTIPQSGDDVIFDNSSKDCVWDISLTLSSLITNSGYSGIITVDADLSVTGDVTISGGTLILNNGNLVTGAAPPSLPPAVTSEPASNINGNAAALNATVNPNGSETTVYFEWGTDTNYGNSTAPQNIGSGTGNIAISANINRLQRNTVYHYRVAAVNAQGTSYGDDVPFTTLGGTTVGATTISSNTTWTYAGSPYIINGNISVYGASEPTLTIEPGVEVRFNGLYYLNIGYSASKGRLTAQGTLSSPIIFTSNYATPSPGNWYGIRFYNHATTESILDYVTVEYGGYQYGGLYLSNSSAIIQNSSVKYSSTDGIYLSGDSAPVITNSIISNNNSEGVYVSGTNASVSYITNSTFENNGSYALDIPVTTVLGNGNVYINSSGIKLTGATISANTTWSYQTTPYIISQNVSVYGTSSEPVLTIEPGVVVKFTGPYYLSVGTSSYKGRLIAQGTSSSPITFTATTLTNGFWYGLRFYKHAAAESILDYVTVEYGGYGSAYGSIYVYDSSPTIQNSTVMHSKYDGVYIYGSTGFSAPVITDSIISDNESEGVFVSGANVSVSSITNTTFENNGSYALDIPVTATLGSGNIFINSSGIKLTGAAISNDTTWSYQTTPYIISQNVSVYSTTSEPTLTIEPGTVVKFTGAYYLSIGYSSYKGRLIAQGTSSAPIIFTSSGSTPGYWYGLRFYNHAAVESIMEYVTVDYAGYNTTYDSVYLYNSSPVIRNSTIQNSKYDGLNILGDSSPVITFSIISNNAAYGINASGTGNVDISFSSISNNLQYAVYSTASVLNVHHCNIIGNGNGVYGVAGKILDARFNWWGSAAGPGSLVNQYVNYEPWLAALYTYPFYNVNLSATMQQFNSPADSVNYTFSISDNSTWDFYIKDPGGNTVKTFSGAGNSGTVIWDGRNESGIIVPDGTYTYQLSSTSLIDSSQSASLIGDVQVNNILPVAVISYPANNQLIGNAVLNIQGTATADFFNNYKVEYGLGADPAVWTLITSSTTPVNNGTLAVWDPSNLTGDFYTLRLSVNDNFTNTTAALVRINLLNINSLNITLPSFSPNGDGINDLTTITALITYSSNWTMDIKNSGGNTVKSFNGSGSSLSITWDGNNSAGAIQPEGVYSFTITAIESISGATAVITGNVTIDFPDRPVVTTYPANNLNIDSATLKAAVNPNGAGTTVYFQWGTDTSYGNNTPVQSAGSGTGNVNVTANLTGLSRGITYHIRAAASNVSGTTYGNDMSFIAEIDTDNDGIININDNCPAASNPDQIDSDGDGAGDVCDNCLSISNPDQIDSDNDGIGNVCDSDIDGDGINNTADNCPLTSNTTQSDSNGDGIGDICTVYHCVTNSTELQQALNIAESNGMFDIIRLEQGTYLISANSNNSFSYDTSSDYGVELYGLSIEGGYSNGCSSRTVEPANTILDGEYYQMPSGFHGVLAISSSSNFESSVSGITIEGITVKKGYGRLEGGGIYMTTKSGDISLKNNIIEENIISYLCNPYNYNSYCNEGGGVYVKSNDGEITLNNNRISDNRTKYSGEIWSFNYGAGLYAENKTKDIVLINNTISQNIAIGGEGGGAWLLNIGGNIIADNNLISSNTSLGSGGGLGIEKYGNGKITLSNNNIKGNGTGGNSLSVTVAGGGVWIYGPEVILFNNMITYNWVSDSYYGYPRYGGGVSINSNLISLTNNTITGNNADEGGGLYLSSSGVADIYNNIIWGNVGSSYGDASINGTGTFNAYNNDFDPAKVYGSFASQGNNINTDPLFVDPVNRDFHLSGNSPLRNQGNNMAPSLPGADFEGHLRIVDSVVDIGADEYTVPSNISVSPVYLDFNDINVGSYSEQTITVTNNGTTGLIIYSVSLPSTPFSIVTDNCSGLTLAADASCSVVVKFAPLTEGQYNNAVTISSDDPNYPTFIVNLIGTAVPLTGILTGIVTDSSTGQLLPYLNVTVVDSSGTHNTLTNSSGAYTVSELVQGNFTAAFEETGYIPQTVNGSIIESQTLTLNVQLSPAPPVVLNITSPADNDILSSSPVTVTGNVNNNASITVNGIQASVSGNLFSASIPLVAGQNTITAAAVDQYGQFASASINVNLPPAVLTGTVTDIATGLPLTDASVTVTDSGNTYSTVTDGDGIYALSNLTHGSFTAIFEHVDYVDKTVTGTLTAGQTTTLNVQVTARLDAWEISAEPSDINFIRYPFTDQLLEITVSNTGSGTLAIQSISSPASPFSIVSNDCLGRSLTATASCSIKVKFAPSSEGTFTDSIIIRSNDADNPELAVNLIGISVASDDKKYLMPDTGWNGDVSKNPLSYTVNGDGTVRDNNTKLIWQQQDDGSARSWLTAVSYCDGLTLGGYADWRLPTGLELITIVHYGQYQPLIDSAVFPNTQSANYWTSQYKSGSEVFFVNFSSGEANYSDNYNTNYVRCVRGRQLPGPGAIAVLNGSGPMTDLSTGLMWGGFVQVPQSYIEEMEGIGLCDTMLNGGYTDWRDPTIKELAGFYINYNSCDSDINYPAEATWSTTADMNDPSQAFAFISCGDAVASYNKSTENYIRCVRGGYSGALDVGKSISVNPAGLNFGSVAVNESLTLTVSVENTGAGNLNIGSLILPSAPFSVVSDGCSGNTLSGTTSCEVAVEFAPVSSGAFTSFLTINSDDADNPEVIVPISGTTMLATQTGTVTDSSTTLPLPSATVSATDSLNITHTTLTDTNGTYVITGLAPGALSGSITKDGYSAYNFTDTVSEGQTITIDAALSQLTPMITDISVINITSDSAVIIWTTDQLADSLVEYGTTTAYGSSESDPVLATGHSITLTALNPGTVYHFKVTSTNTFGVSLSSGDNAFTTSLQPVTVTTIGDYGNVTVMEITGNYDAKNPDGSINTVPRQEVAKEFLRLHSDQYDFMVIFSNFDFAMPEVNAKAFYSEVKNTTQGIGKLLFNNSDLFGSSKLQGTIDMGNISNVISNPVDPMFDDTISILAHEQMHRWGASIKFRDTYGNDSTALLGKDGTHWSFLLDSEASVLYGNDWMDNSDGTFTSTGGGKYYSPLDLYLAGFYDRTQVPQMLLIDNPLIDATRLPEVGTTISGTSRFITIDDIITAEGDRIPSVSTSQKSFKTVFILVTRPGTYNSNVLPGIETIRNAWAGRFTSLTDGKGTIMDIAPSISITMGSPSNGSTISGSYVDVKGAVINNTGNETGVTVNGIVATVYGTQFIAENIPLAEGSNTITVTATDTAGNTATSSLTVNALTTGDYIRLSSNIESGILPLDVTLKIDGSFSITNSSLNITGTAQPTILSSSADEYTVRMNAEGIYYITASATGPDSNVYQDTVEVLVFNKTQLDTLLKGKWEGMKGALGSGNISAALNYYTEGSRSHYNQIFTDMYNYLPQFVQEMQDIQVLYVKDGAAKYRIRRNEIYGGQAVTITYYIYFVVERDGIWRINIF